MLKGLGCLHFSNGFKHGGKLLFQWATIKLKFVKKLKFDRNTWHAMAFFFMTGQKITPFLSDCISFQSSICKSCAHCIITLCKSWFIQLILINADGIGVVPTDLKHYSYGSQCEVAKSMMNSPILTPLQWSAGESRGVLKGHLNKYNRIQLKGKNSMHLNFTIEGASRLRCSSVDSINNI